MKVNEYFDGNVRSISFENSEGRVSAGVMNAGEFEFGTSQDERMLVTCGEMHAKLPDDSEYQTFAEGDEFFVAAGNKFQVKIESPVSYLCFYG